MTQEPKPKTAHVNGRLWGARSHDWANIQEGTVRPVYRTVLERTGVSPSTNYLDVGCGAGSGERGKATAAARALCWRLLAPDGE